jgi:predicted glutamine amidotransferase
MCGIVGVVTAASNGFIQDELNIFRDMLVVDSVRGFDSTGVFGVSNQGNVEIVKSAMTGSQFVTTDEYGAFSREAYSRGQFLVGHNRYATRGTVNDKNAHPFWVDDKIILVQNGSYKGSHKHHKDVEVDTEAITHVIAEEDDVSKALKKINAAYALVWYNTETHSLYMIRNDERPLWHADTKFGSVLFASEPEFIFMAASRNKVGLKEIPKQLTPGTLYKYTLDKDKTWTYTEEVLDIQYDFRSGPANAYHGVVGGAWYGSGRAPWREHLEEIQNELEAEAANDRGKITQLPGKDPGSVVLTSYAAVAEGDFNEFAVNEENSRKLTQLVSDNYNKRHMVEFFDYKPGNTHKDCSVWHLYGRVLEAVETDDPRVLYQKTVWNKTEEEVLKMLMQGIYTVSVRSPMTNIVKNRTEENNRIVTVCVYDESLVSVYEPENAIQ